MSRNNNTQIAKNTLLLYIRMIVLMVVSLYTSRVVLKTLGVSDFGIYNVVGGIVAMFTLLSGAMSNAISRFLTFELGKGLKERLKIVFSTAVNVQIIIGVVIAILIEIIGVWFLNTHMNIPQNRIVAANWVLQISIISFIVNLISVPYNAAIIAHEKMSAFAYISIYEAVMKLLVVYLLYISYWDKLVTYSFLLLCVSLSLRIIYGIYCKRKFQECSYSLNLNKPLLREMTSFASWNFIGSGSYLLMTQGVNMLLNVFFGVTFNAARGIATQVESIVTQFTNNFGTAINPQITKSYAQGNIKYMNELVLYGSKYSFFLLAMLCLPLILEADGILHLWLGTIPDYAPLFLRLTLCISMLSVISNTLVTSMMATGNIKRYQLIVGGLGMSVFPVVYMLYKTGYPPESSYYVQFFIFIIQLLSRLWLLRKMTNFPIKLFVNKVIVKDLLVLIGTLSLPCVVVYFMEESLYRIIMSLFLCEISAIIAVYIFGLDVNEKEKLKSIIKNRIYGYKKTDNKVNRS